MRADRAPGTDRRMRAAVLAGPEQAQIECVSAPAPGPGEVRVRLEGSGVCASNLPVWEGRSWFAYPLPPGAPGHEGWGTIEAIGLGVPDRLLGARVAALSGHAYAEYDVAPAGSVVPLSDSLADRPFPGEALACAVNVFARSATGPAHTLAIVGIGFLGALLVQLGAAARARVIAVSRRRFALEVARRAGASVAIALDDPAAAAAHVRDLTDGRGADVVIEAAGMQDALDLATELTRERGRLVIAGYHQDGLRHVNMQLWNWRALEIINAHERDPEVCVAGLRTAIDLVTRGVLDPAPLYTHVLPLARLSEAFRLLRDRPDGFLKALVVT